MGGRVPFSARDDINSRQVLNNLVPTHVEIIWVKLTSSSTMRLMRNVYACVVHVPPRSPYHQEITDHIIDMVDLISSTEEAVVLIMEDFSDLRTDVIEQHALLTQLVVTPT